MIKITPLFQKPSMNPSPPLTPATRSTAPAESGLHRGISTGSALGINIIDMVGVGPFVTLPLLVIAMGGPPAILGWVLGALLSLCDGLIWSELGTAYPEAGGSYVYIKHLFGGRLGHALAFLYAWQLLFSAPLSIASGCIGFSQYASYFLPHSGKVYFSTTLLHIPIILGPQTLIAMGVCLLAVAVLLIAAFESLDRIVKSLGIAVVLAILWIIFVGFTHFNPHRAFDFPPGAFHLNHAFFDGLGVGLLISAYDYWGYYNICFLGAEVRDPQRTIPRAVLGSICIVATLYILMNISVLGVIPWRELSCATGLETRMYTWPTSWSASTASTRRPAAASPSSSSSPLPHPPLCWHSSSATRAYPTPPPTTATSPQSSAVSTPATASPTSRSAPSPASLSSAASSACRTSSPASSSFASSFNSCSRE